MSKTTRRRSLPATRDAVESFPPFKAESVFPVVRDPADDREVTARKIAEQVTAPETNAWRVLRASEGSAGFSELLDTAGVLEALRLASKQVNAGDLSRPEAMLISQAVALEALSARLIDRGMAQGSLAQFETFMRLGLKAQAQSRLAIEALANLKNGPLVIAKQANLSGGGPMQVNNGQPRARNFENKPNGLLTDEQSMDTGETGKPGAGDSNMAPVGAIDRPEKRRRQTALRRQRV